MRVQKLLASVAGIGAFLVPVLARAAYEPIVVPVNAGFAVSFESVFKGLMDVMLMWAMPIAVALFTYGAFRMAASGGGDIAPAKSIMKASLVGFAIIAGSYLILSTIVYIIAGA